MKDKLFPKTKGGATSAPGEEHRRCAPASLSAPSPHPHPRGHGGGGLGSLPSRRSLLVTFPAGVGFKERPGNQTHQGSAEAAFQEPLQAPRPRQQASAQPACRAHPGARGADLSPPRAGQARVRLPGGQASTGETAKGHPRSLAGAGCAEPGKSPRPPPNHLPSKCPAPGQASWRHC